MLEDYFSFQHKSQILNSEKIDTQNQFDDLIGKLTEHNVYRTLKWRGMNDAKLKLSNSCQRYYSRIMNNDKADQYHEFIVNLVDYVSSWNNSTVSRYLESQEIENDIVAVMTLMQHFGFPTPLLDFSDDPFIALYFASKHSNYSANEDDINNYCSLYSLDTNIPNLKDFNEQYKIARTPYSNQFLPLLSTKLLVISKETPEFKIGTNLNIINQAGLFIFYNDPVLPLEELLAQTNNNEAETTTLKCWHIHKKFNQQIRLLLERSYSITDDYVFPDLYKMIEHFHQGR
jgi:hypothetical protein